MNQDRMWVSVILTAAIMLLGSVGWMSGSLSNSKVDATSLDAADTVITVTMEMLFASHSEYTNYVVNSFDPSSGPLSGGQSIRLRGGFPAVANASSIYNVYFGDRIAEYQSELASFFTADDIYVVSPEGDTPGSVDVFLVDTLNNFQVTDSNYGTMYTYLDPFSVWYVEPNRGPIGGGNPVTVVGSFPVSHTITSLAEANAYYSVLFDGNRGSFEPNEFGSIISASTIYVSAPPGIGAGYADVTVHGDGIGDRTLRNGYRYSSGYGIQSVNPNSGALIGGQTVRIEGTFPSIASASSIYTVYFGDNVADYQTSIDSFFTVDDIYVVSPEGDSPGNVDVFLFDTLNKIQVTASDYASGYYYTDPFSVWYVDPNRGPIEGGNPVAVVGSFPVSHTITSLAEANAYYSVWFDGNQGSFVANEFGSIISASTIYASTPPGFGPGYADVTVHVDGIGDRTLWNGYQYLAGYDIYSVNPNSGSLNGGQTIRLNGTFPSFADAASVYTVYFDDNVADYQTSIDSFFTADDIYVISPPAISPGTVDISIYDTVSEIYNQIFIAEQTYAYTYVDDNPYIPEITVFDSVGSDSDLQMAFGTISALAQLTQSIEIFSSGTSPLTILGINQAVDADPFTLSNTPTLPLVLNPGESSIFDVLVGDGQNPYLGAYSDSILIDTDVSTAPTVSVSLSVNGEAQGKLLFTDTLVPIDDHKIDFGFVNIDNSAVETVTIENIGLALSTVENVYVVGPEYYVDTFENDLAQNWYFRKPENWSVFDGTLRAHEVYDVDSSIALLQDRQYTDVSVEMDWESDHVRDSWGFVLLRATLDTYAEQDPSTGGFFNVVGSFYRLAVSRSGAYEVYKGANGVVTLLASGQIAEDLNLGNNHLKGTAVGNQLEFFVNGQLISSIIDNEISFGYSGFGGTATASINETHYFDNVIIEDLASTPVNNPFSVTLPVSMPFGITDGTSINLDVTFEPQSTSFSSGALLIHSNDTEKPVFPVELRGHGVDVPPNVTTSPSSLDVVAGSNVTFTVSASGTNLAYQWEKDQVEISGVTSRTFDIDSVENSHEGQYRCIVTNSASFAISAEASLIVLYAPTIDQGPGPILVTIDEDGAPNAWSTPDFTATDLDNDTLAWSVSSLASFGEASVLYGALDYAPNGDYNGADSFTIQVSDGYGGIDTIAVDVTVNARNDPPNNTGRPSIAGTGHVGKQLTAITGTWNDDTDKAPGNITYTYQWQRLEVEVRRAFNDDGVNLIDIPNATNTTYSPTLVDNGGYLRIKVTATDDGEGSPTTQSTDAYSSYVFVDNAAPTIDQGSGPISVTIDEDESPSVWSTPALSATDTDLDTLTWSVLAGNGPGNGTATVSGTGASPSIFNYAPDLNWNGIDHFTVQVSDGYGGAETIVVDVTVTAQNDSPINTVQPSIAGTGHVGKQLTSTTGTWNDDIDQVPGNITYSYQWQRANNDAGVNLIDISNTTNPIYLLTSIDNGKYIRIKVTATDDGEGSPTTQSTDAYSAYIFVDNAAPTIDQGSGPILVTIDEDGAPAAWSVSDLTATDLDNDTLAWSVSSFASFGVASVVYGALDYVPNDDYNGADSFTIQVSDDYGGTDTIAVDITVNPRNDVPINTVQPSIVGTGHVGKQLTATTGTWNDDTDQAPGIITYSYQWQRANHNAGENLVDISNATNTMYSLTSADNGKYVRIKVTATDDGEGFPSTQSTHAYSAFIFVDNAAPTIDQGSGPISVTIDEDESPSVWSTPALSATDTDLDTLTWSVLAGNGPGNGTATVSGTGASPSIFNYAPDLNWNGIDHFTVQVSDGYGGAESIVVDVTVTAQNDSPTLTLLGDSIIAIPVGTMYDDPGTLALDQENGDITGSVIARIYDGKTSDYLGGLNSIDTSELSTYFITFDVTDSDSASASQVTREVHVINGNLISSEIWVDYWNLQQGDGSNERPFATFREGYTHVMDGGEIHVGAGDYSETIVLQKSVTISAVGAVVRIGVDAPPTGTLIVSLSPSEAVSSGAKWKLDSDSTWRDPGTIADVPVGNRKISFKTITNWVTPITEMVVISDGATLSVEATYEELTGEIQENLIYIAEDARFNFDRYDTDNDGLLDIGEWTAAGLDAIYLAILAGGDNQITMSELLAGSGLTPNSLGIVYVDFGVSVAGDGSSGSPFRTLTEALGMVALTGTGEIRMKPGDSSETFTGGAAINPTAKIVLGWLTDSTSNRVKIGTVPIAQKLQVNQRVTSTETLSKPDFGVALSGLIDEIDEVNEQALQNEFKNAIFEVIVPNTKNADGDVMVLADGRLALRLRDYTGLEVETLWAELHPQHDSEEVFFDWKPVAEGDDRDIWLFFSPTQTWYLNDLLTIVAGGMSAEGAEIASDIYTVQVESLDEFDSREVEIPADTIAQPDYVETDETIGNDAALTIATHVPQVDEYTTAYHILPYQVFDTPQRIWLPIESGTSIDSITLMYFKGNEPNQGWHNAEDIEGFLADHDPVIESGYVGFVVNHAGAVAILGL